MNVLRKPVSNNNKKLRKRRVGNNQVPIFFLYKKNNNNNKRSINIRWKPCIKNIFTSTFYLFIFEAHISKF